MHSPTAILLATVTSTFAYQITTPGGPHGWTTAGPNSMTWVRVDTDPLNFTVMLTNQACNPAAMPQGSQILDQYINGTLGQTVCSAPSGGWPEGYAFQVNLVNAEDLNTLLAQSDQFNITASISSGGSSTQSSTSSTSSTTSTTPTGTNAAAVGMNVETGFLTAVAAMAAFITTHF
ncbi:uncharacterized protein EDB91DRAFT_1295476 [Suillus paluster]|uniref:uncharacterized protein n=1 Tax=Suillus paluster TaxID=48578 RepID=UPI001B86CBE1|nr:uncharacterized protein EDB91DRAFT_1295476 [Suillus paluster]KAG1735281.1 hypothetical protein EDB91DRAFT_1295476 [Suillus paluster]